MDVKPYEKNAKKHPSKQIEQIANSIKRFGMNQPIVVDNGGTIIVGHGRYLALQKLGWEIKPEYIKRLENLTPEEVNAYRLADNKLNESDWDMGLVIEELKALEDAELVTLTGFDTDLLIEPEEKDDLIPQNPPTVAQLGDIWQLGQHRVMCGDSTQIEAVSMLMDGKKVDMVFTDPPYGVDYVSRVDENRRKPWGEIKNDNLEGDELKKFISDAVPVSLRCHQYICCNWQSVKDFFDALGMPNSLIVWDKKSIGLGANYRSQHEFILFYGKLSHRSESNVWGLKRDSVSSYTHPTQKPVELIVRAVTNSSEQGNAIYDAFLGSGSTLIAAQKTGRICYGMELDPKYVDVIIKRWEDYTGEKAVKVS